MRKGDRVIVRNDSYSTVVVDGELKCGHESPHTTRYKQCIIVELGCRFPRTSPWKGDNHNDTVVQIIKTGEVVFIEERFLQPTTHEIIIDGKTIKLSHESYNNLKEQLI